MYPFHIFARDDLRSLFPSLQLDLMFDPILLVFSCKAGHIFPNDFLERARIAELVKNYTFLKKRALSALLTFFQRDGGFIF